MTLSDIIALAKQGYKPNDIKELIALGENEPEAKPEPENPAEELPAQSEEEKEPVTQEAVDEVDYKALYEDTLKKLGDAQKQNINQEIPTDTDDLKDLTNIFKSFR